MKPIFPTSYFGNIEFYKKLSSYDSVLVESYETYPKQTFRNRCEITTANGLLPLSIPIEKPNGSKTRTNEILLSSKEKWQLIHWRAIEAAYASSPYFEYYEQEVKELIFQQELNLTQFNHNIIKRIQKWLDLPTQLIYTDKYNHIDSNLDFRNLFSKSINPREFQHDYYQQVFEIENGFFQNVSILDSIFCLGPMARLLVV
ncbi:MAG: WbqC family protein [Crocinitomicaceae bacterium]